MNKNRLLIDQNSNRCLRAIYIDMAYTWAMIKQKGHLAFLSARHANGNIEEVWSVHPAADVTSTINKSIEIRHPLARHVILESRSGEGGGSGIVRRLLRFVWSQMRLVFVLRRVIRDRQIDLIVTGDPFYTALFSIALRQVTGVPVVVCAWGNYDFAYRSTGSLAMPRLIPNYRMQQWVTRFALSRADHVVVGNRNNQDYVFDNGASKERTTIVPVITNLSACHFVPPAERKGAADFFASYNIPVDARCMSFVGRLIKLKYAEDAVQTMIEVAKDDPRAFGIVAGEGDLADDLRAIVRNVGLERRIIFTGNISQQLLSEILPRCVTISPLTGMALIECGMAGSPIVAFDVDWHAEFVANYENGFIVPIHDVSAMAARLREIFADEGLRARLSSVSRAKAVAFADVDRVEQLRQKAYHMALAHARRRRFGCAPQAAH